MGDEAGQPLSMILSRKEEERKRGNGIFFWGIGTALGSKVWAFIDSTQNPLAIFSPMKSKAQKSDIDPDLIFAWTSYMDKMGHKRAMPDHALVLSRGNSLTKVKQKHYALVCRKDTPLLDEKWPDLNWSKLCNFMGESKVGNSQVTALVESRDWTHDKDRIYDVLFGAELVEPYYITLVDPVVFPKGIFPEGDGSYLGGNDGIAYKHSELIWSG